jgi:hypothetical protein
LRHGEEERRGRWLVDVVGGQISGHAHHLHEGLGQRRLLLQQPDAAADEIGPRPVALGEAAAHQRHAGRPRGVTRVEVPALEQRHAEGRQGAGADHAPHRPGPLLEGRRTGAIQGQSDLALRVDLGHAVRDAGRFHAGRASSAPTARA